MNEKEEEGRNHKTDLVSVMDAPPRVGIKNEWRPHFLCFMHERDGERTRAEKVDMQDALKAAPS